MNPIRPHGMSPGTIPEEWRRQLPEFQSAYAEGFEAGKRAAIREMKEAIARAKEKEPFVTFTVAATSDPTV